MYTSVETNIGLRCEGYYWIAIVSKLTPNRINKKKKRNNLKDLTNEIKWEEREKKKETTKSGIELIRLDHSRKITNNKSC